jgi:hypothetical protein
VIQSSNNGVAAWPGPVDMDTRVPDG